MISTSALAGCASLQLAFSRTRFSNSSHGESLKTSCSGTVQNVHCFRGVDSALTVCVCVCVCVFSKREPSNLRMVIETVLWLGATLGVAILIPKISVRKRPRYGIALLQNGSH